jgi:hypothetical protein
VGQVSRLLYVHQKLTIMQDFQQPATRCVFGFAVAAEGPLTVAISPQSKIPRVMS